MLEFELQKSAHKLIHDIFGVKEKETVAITADTKSDPVLVNAVAAAVYNAGGFPTVITIACPKGVGKAADPDIPVELLTAALSTADVWIEFNEKWLLYSTPFEVSMKNNPKLRYMCLVDFTPELLIRTVGDIDIAGVKEFMEEFGKRQRMVKKMHVTTPAGTDVEFDIDDSHVVAVDCGKADVPGFFMCPGQLNVVPRFGSVNGKIVFDGTITPPFGSIPSEPVVLTVQNSKIVKFEGGREAAEYEKFLKGFNDDGMLKMAHMAYGFNPGAKLSGNVVEDERVWGCTEWGIGYVSEIEAPPIGQPAVSHTDGICLNSTIYFDGKKIMEEGKIVDEELAKLSPVK